MTGPVVPPGGGELRDAVARGLCPNEPPCDTHAEQASDLLTAFAEEQGRRRAAEELLAAAKWALLEAASHEGYAAKGMARNSDLRAAEARVFRAASNRLTARAAALAPENARPE